MQALPQLQDGAVKVFQVLLALCDSLPNHELVVPQRLHLQEIVKLRDGAKLPPALPLHNGPEQLPCLAGGADDEALSVFFQLAFGDAGLLEEMVQMGIGNQTVQVFQAGIVLYQKDDMVGAAFDVAFGRKGGVNLPHRFGALFGLELFQHPQEDAPQHQGVVVRPVVVLLLHPQVLRQKVQLVLFQLRIEGPGHNKGINAGKRPLHPQAVHGAAQKAHIKGGVVGHQNTAIPAEGKEPLQRLPLQGGILHHLVGDAGEADNLRGNAGLWVHKGIKVLQNLPALHPDRTDFSDAVVGAGKARGLQVKDDIFPADGLLAGALHRGNHVVHKVSLYPVNDLEVRIVFPP